MDVLDVVLEEFEAATAEEASVSVVALVNRVKSRLDGSWADGPDVPSALLQLAAQGRLSLPEGTGLFAEVHRVQGSAGLEE